MALELRPSHDPEATWGFVGIVISTEDHLRIGLALVPRRRRLEGREGRHHPRRTRGPGPGPPALKPFAAVPPLITDIDLSVDDRFLYVSCWGTGEMKQFDVSDPANPKEVGSVRLGEHGQPNPAPGQARYAALRRSADGRGQP